MKIKTVVSDIDATLLPPDSGIRLKDEVASIIYELEQSGVMMILASARAYAGVVPIAEQLHMDTLGGYIIAENGASVYDAKSNALLYAREMDRSDVLSLWKLCKSYDADFAFSQTDCMIASDFSKGFVLDHKNCDLDYIVSDHPQRYMKDAIMKCSVSKNEDKIAELYPILKAHIEQQYPYAVTYSTANILDISAKDCSKANALQQLAEMNLMKWEETAAIGDGCSDAEMIQRAALGATLTNGKPECKKIADMIVESCYEDGCISFFKRIIKLNSGSNL